MTRLVYDQFSKDYLEKLLKPYGKVKSSKKIAGEIREIDVWFSPFPRQNTSINTLGLLGKIARKPAIFEAYRNPASLEEICDCISKILEVRAAFRRKAKRKKTRFIPAKTPHLWILTPTASQRKLSRFDATSRENWLSGIYFLAAEVRIGIVVIHQLPCIPETLWLRLLGRGSVQKQAIDELESLPENHPFRHVTLEMLYNLEQHLKVNQEIDDDDRELIMRLAPLYQQDKAQAIQEAVQEAVQEARQREARLIMRLLDRQIGEIDSSLTEQVEQLSIEQVELLAEALLDFSTVTDLESWLLQHRTLPNDR